MPGFFPLGTERMTEALNPDPGAAPEELVLRVKDAPQFDDMTMLCFRYFGPEGVR